MNVSEIQDFVPAVKDLASERPIPSAWRPVLKQIVSDLAQHDYQLSKGIAEVAPVSAETADQIRNYVASYGATLTELPDETWISSVCMWNGKRWDALIDLWTLGEGRSDLLLAVQVTESEHGFAYAVYMVYVP
ncbi:hypothetical protein C1O66_17175 [Paucibacter aquatile]|uniref:DUF7668 domain-containing protein n=2 Tax=Kinneretia aquatilis TaxID=2070761 RepID=A0A2N8L047_9BURK|nr:hypothetical protein C1O66_17175 [Paucibacter aquatile]